MTQTKDYAVTLGPGRAVDVSEGGDPKGVPVFVMHGSPGSRLLFEPHSRDAKERGIRLIGHSRPGYGGSTRREGRDMADGASEVAAVADALGIGRFAVWGHSGGGVYALACAALLPDRVVAASSLSTMAPFRVEGFDFFAGMGEFNAADIRLMLADRARWEAKSKLEIGEMLKQSKAERMKEAESFLPPPDRAVNSDEVDEYFHALFAEGFRNGIYGNVDDCLATASPWGFEPSSIRVPVQVWHGKEDTFVPFSHGLWLAARMPQAEAHLEEGEGHASMFVKRVPEVQGWLASKF